MPNRVSSFDEIAPFFLNAQFCVPEMIVFSLYKSNLKVELRLKNMRRAYPDGYGLLKDIRKKEEQLTDENRRLEKVYYLQLSFSEYRKKVAG